MNTQIVPLPLCKTLKLKYKSLCLVAVASLMCLMTVNLPCAGAGQQQEKWKAGVASAVITPEQSMWMSGFAARTKPSEGKVHDLHAKALALEDSQGTRLVIVAIELLGIPRHFRDWLEKEVHRRYKLEPDYLLLNASHTHCGPVVKESKYSIYGNSFYGLSDEQIKQNRQYVETLQQRLLQLIGRAIENLAPARLGYTHARAGFAMNRRAKIERGFRIHPNPDGPVDHDVPVLRIDNPKGKLQAVLFGYACHSTTLSFYKFCGDYPGFTCRYIEQAHPGAMALFMSGCGGDQNPYPRGNLDYCMQHGRSLANAVEAALLPRARPVSGPVRAALETVTLDFAEPPGREQLEKEAKSTNKYVRRHAEALLEQMEQKGGIRTTYPYPLQVVQFGDDLIMIAMAGEVVVDYSLRFKAELPGPPVWVAGYSNDVFGYLPSVRILKEGGYEGGGAMLYTQLPGPFAPSVEKRVVDKVHELVGKVRLPKIN